MTTESGSGDADVGFLVPVSDSPTLDATVEYAAREAREVAAETDGHVSLYLVAPVILAGPPETAGRRVKERRLEEAGRVAAEAIEVTDPQGTVDVETTVLELRRYPLDPIEYVDAIVDFAEERGVATVVVDPEHRMPSEVPIRRSLRAELEKIAAVDLEVAPVERRARQGRLVTRGGLAQFATLAAVSWAFYLLIGGFREPVFDVVTGAIAAVLVAGVLSRVTFERTPNPVRTVATVGRWLLYVPYLLWKILTANVQIAYVVLHPSLPIDPTIERFEPGVWGGMATATLANSITLTPGTLTVDVRDREFVVHALTEGSRQDLLDGGLERAVRFVFYGRSGFEYPSPRERLESGDSPSAEAGDEDVLTDGGDDVLTDGGEDVLTDGGIRGEEVEDDAVRNDSNETPNEGVRGTETGVEPAGDRR